MDKQMLQGKVAIITGASTVWAKPWPSFSLRKERLSSSPPGDRKN